MALDSVSRLKEEGNCFFRTAEFKQALTRYEAAVKCLDSSGGNVDTKEVLYSNIAQCYLKLELFVEAVEAASKALDLNPTNQKAMYRRALAFEKLGKLKESLEDATTLIRRGNKEAMVILERVRPNLLAKQSHHIDEMLPETILAMITSTTEKLQSHPLTHAPFLSSEEANAIIRGTDSLRTWVIRYNRRRMVVNNGTILKLISLLKIRCSSESEVPMNRLNGTTDPKLDSEIADSSQTTSTEPAAEASIEAAISDTPETMADMGGISSTAAEHPLSSFGDTRLLPLVTDRDVLNVHLAIWRLLAALITDTSYSADEEEQEKLRSIQIRMLEKPVNVDPVITAARECFQSHLGFDEIFDLFKAYVRAGLGSLDVSLDSIGADAHDSAVRSRCAVLISECLRCIGSLDGGACLEALALGISSIECQGVVRASLQALGGLADCRRRYGNKVKALKKSQGLMKALESTLQLLSTEDKKVKEDAEFALTSVFALLGDKDRAPEDEVCIQDLASVLLGPYLVQGCEPIDSYIGLRALLLLWMADRETVKVILSSNQYVSVLVHLTCERNPICPSLQRVAAEVLMHAMEFGELRTEFLEVDGVIALSDLCRCQLRHERDAELRIKVAATLARLCMHAEEVRQEVFKEFDFLEVAADSLRQFKVSCPDKSESGSVAQFKQTLRNFLEVLFFLTLHGAFKSDLLHILEADIQESKESPLASTLSDIGSSIVSMTDGLGGYYFSNVFCNLLRSREDKEKRKRRNNQSGPQLDDEQMDALQEFFDKLPEHGRPAQNGKFDRGTVDVVNALTDIFVRHKIGKYLCQLCQIKSATLNEISSASEAIGLFARVPKHRGIIVQQGAVAALLVSASALEGGKETYEQDLSRCRQSLAHVCISINPNLLTYREVLDIIPHLLALLEDTYQLYQYESCLALTNITSSSEDARNRVFHGRGWSSLLNVATDENDMCRAAGLEGLCNMAMCELVQDRFAEGFQTVDLQILLAFLGEKENARAQSAAAGCLAILTSDCRVALRLCGISNVSNIARTLKDEEDMRTKPAVLLRVMTIASNIASSLKIDQPILIKEQKEDEEPMLLNITDDMRAVKDSICNALLSVDRSYYGAQVLELANALIAR